MQIKNGFPKYLLPKFFEKTVSYRPIVFKRSFYMPSISYPKFYLNLEIFVIPAGVEPTTDRLEICCSIQLSYGINK